MSTTLRDLKQQCFIFNMIKSLYYRLTCHCVTMNPKKESIKSVEHELETLLLIAWMPCLLHHHQHTSRDTPAGKKEEIVRWWDGSINSPRNAIQNITLHMIQIGRTNTRKLWGEGDLYYATAGQKLPFAIKKRKRKKPLFSSLLRLLGQKHIF